jgi:hypothetical protein
MDMRKMEEILHISDIAEEFTMIQCLYSISVTLDDDKLIIKPGVTCPEYFGALNDPLLVINPDGEVVIIHEDDDTRWVEHFHGIYPPHMFVKVNPHDWNSYGYSEKQATIIRDYVLELAKMWAEYNA